MADASIRKRVARFTKPLRSLTSRKGLARLTRPFRQTVSGTGTATVKAQPSLISARVSAETASGLEARLQRLEAGWSQHIPALLDSVSSAIAEARRADSVHARVDAVRADLDRLAARLDLGLLDIKIRKDRSNENLGSWACESQDSDVHVASIAGLAAALLGDLNIQFFDGGECLPGHLTIATKNIVGCDIVADSGVVLQFGVGRTQSIIVDSAYPLGDNEGTLAANLEAWLTLLAKGAKLRIHRIDFSELLVDAASGKLDVASLSAEYSDASPQFSPRWPSAEQIASLMKDKGFKNVRVTTDKGRPGRTVSGSKAIRHGSDA